MSLTNRIKKMSEFLFLLSVFIVFLGAASVDLREIETAILKEDFESAQRLAKTFIENKPVKKDLDQAIYFLGLSQLRQNHYEEARNSFNLLISSFRAESLRDKSYLGYIDSLYLEGQYPDALNVCEEFLSKRPRTEYLSLLYLKFARIHLKLMQWQKAKDDLQKIVHEFPSSLEAYTAKQLLEEKQYFAVQGGAFLDQTRAEKLVTDLEKKGEYAYIVETIDREGRKFFRVRVGKLSLLNEAQQLEKKLSQLGYPTRIYP